MDLQSTLNLIGYALILLGVLIAGLRISAAEEGAYGCRYALTFSWLCVIAGLILSIVNLYVEFDWQTLLQEIAYAIILGGVLIAAPMLRCHNQTVCHASKSHCKSIVWLSLTTGLVLLVISVYLSVHVQTLLATIAYAFFIFSLIFLLCKLFKCMMGAVTWLSLLAGFILLLIAIYK